MVRIVYKVAVMVLVAGCATIFGSAPAQAGAQLLIAQPEQAAYAGTLDTRVSGHTTACKSEPETSLALACSLNFTLTKDICAVNVDLLDAGSANYANYGGTVKSWKITLSGVPNHVGVFAGTALLADGYTFIRVTVNAAAFCDEQYIIGHLGTQSAALPAGAFSGEATYRAGS